MKNSKKVLSILLCLLMVLSLLPGSVLAVEAEEAEPEAALEAAAEVSPEEAELPAEEADDAAELPAEAEPAEEEAAEALAEDEAAQVPQYLADGSIGVNSANFPDYNFLLFVEASYDSNHDNALSAAEIAAVTEMNCSNESLDSLKGIEYFTALTKLDCSINKLTALDVSKNTALTYLDCGINRLTELDVSQNTALEELYCSFNSLTALDVSSLPNLFCLECCDNYLTFLDITATKVFCEKKSSKLGEQKDEGILTVIMTDTQLTIFNETYASWAANTGVNAFSTAEVVYINDKNFPSDNFRKYVSSKIDKDSNGLLTADEINAVTVIECNMSHIDSLTGIEYFTALERLNCRSNQLTYLDLSKNTALTTLLCYDNQLTTLDLSKNTALTTLLCYSNQLTSLYVSQCTALTSLYCYSNLLSSLSLNKHSSLRDLRCQNNKMTYLNIFGTQVAGGSSNPAHLGNQKDGRSITVIMTEAQKTVFEESFAGLGDNTGVIPFTVSGSVAITTANFPDENFRIYLSKYKDTDGDGVLSAAEIAACGSFDCNNKSISSLQGIEYLPALRSLSCEFNKLTSLDVSKNTLLATLNCGCNQLTSLNVTKNTNLEYLDCSYNQLKALDVSNTALTSLNCHNNRLTSLNVGNNTALASLFCYNNQLTFLDVSKCTALASLSCYENQLTSLDVSKDTALRYLDCKDNQLTSLDVSANTALVSLFCQNNQLTSLNVGNNAALTRLDCYDNQLTSLDASKCTALASLFCYDNQLTSLDVSKDIALQWLDCSDNQLTSLNVTTDTDLEYLSCYDNQLTSLNVSKNAKLETLYCAGNKLTKLDVSQTGYCRDSDRAHYLVAGDQQDNKTISVIMTEKQYALYARASFFYDARVDRVSPLVSGDVNGDCHANLEDVSLLYRYLTGELSSSALNRTPADLNADGKVNLRDVAAIFNRYTTAPTY